MLDYAKGSSPASVSFPKLPAPGRDPELPLAFPESGRSSVD